MSKTLSIKNVDGVEIAWSEVEALAVAGMKTVALAERFGIKEATIRQRKKREKWPTPVAIAARASQIVNGKSKNETITQLAAEEWLAKGEEHRLTAFNIASESVAKFRPKAPKNFRELKAADDVARRAAGLDIADTNVGVLIQMHERMNNFENEEKPEEIIIEGEIVPETLPAAAGSDPALLEESKTSQP